MPRLAHFFQQQSRFPAWNDVQAESRGLHLPKDHVRSGQSLAQTPVCGGWTGKRALSLPVTEFGWLDDRFLSQFSAPRKSQAALLFCDLSMVGSIPVHRRDASASGFPCVCALLA